MHRRLLALVCCAAFLGALALPTASAQATTSAETMSAPLSLGECLRTALANNLDLVSARKDPTIAEQRIEINDSVFDGSFSAGASFNDSEGDEVITDNTSNTRTTGTSASEFINSDVSFSHLLEFGGAYSLTYNLTDIDASATSVQASTGFLTESSFVQQTNGFTLNYSMPLLNGFGTETNTVNVLLAQGARDISSEDLRLQAMLTLQSVEDAYWDVLAAREAVRISKLSLKRAEDLLALNRKKVEVGTLAPIEITEAEAGVAAQVEAVIVSETTVQDLEDRLLQLMAEPEDSPLWDQALQLIDRPSFMPVDLDLQQLIDTAMTERPEMSNARQRLRDSELSRRVAQRGLRHGLDLNASITPNEQDDIDRRLETLNAPFPPSDTTTDSEDTNWSIGLRYTWPLGNRAAKANFAIARLNAEKSEVAVRSVEQDIRVDVRRAARNLQSGVQRVEAARKNVELQQKKLEAEQKKFDNGMSTSFEVLTFQNDLADAELSEIRARLEYLKALTDLERAKGTLLEARGLSLAG